MKKTPGDINILHMCTKNYDEMMYSSRDMVRDGRTDRQMDRPTDRPTDGWRDGRTDGRMEKVA